MLDVVGRFIVKFAASKIMKVWHHSVTAQVFRVHPDNPQQRLLRMAADLLMGGGVIIYPTDSCYALGCCLGNKEALDRIRLIRHLDKNHLFTLACRNISEIADYARVENVVYRYIRSNTPGAYTFILPARNKVPRRLQHPSRKTIGMRVPDNNIALGLLDQLNEPLMTTSLILDQDDMPYNDIDLIVDRFSSQVDLIIDGGVCGFEETSVIDMVTGHPELIREGKGDVTALIG